MTYQFLAGDLIEELKVTLLNGLLFKLNVKEHFENIKLMSEARKITKA